MKKKEWKSITIDKETYLILKAKQNELIGKNNGDNVELSYVAEMSILKGIDKVQLDSYLEK